MILLENLPRYVVGLDGCRSGQNAALAADTADRGNLSQARHRAPGAHPAFGPRRADDQQVHRPTPRRPRGHPLSERRPQVSVRQPVLRSAVQDPVGITPCFPGRFARHYRRQSPSAGRSSPGTTPSTAMRGIAMLTRADDVHHHRAPDVLAQIPRTYPASRLGPSPRTLRPRHPENPPRFPKPSGSTHPPLPQQEKRVSTIDIVALCCEVLEQAPSGSTLGQHHVAIVYLNQSFQMSVHMGI